eukprot:CAMPEP_0182419208 /NCGR_PEP_ID=MMETSP1167-20130531/3623_1 /TAXON_ID=2988 /ORGANISM="Mallomonas Sp, Strain CCMP3275" /LENGTH=315 /DNA_ID=CAMNT_0024593925 /DNA_START=111 /DNA_END=1058 /DNA_ORIENTATION=-
MEESITLRVLAIFINLFASLCGVGLPIYLGKNFSPDAMRNHFGFSILRIFSAGIMVGVAFIHLLADAATTLPKLYPQYEALPFTLTTMGIVIVLAVENAIISFVKPSHHERDSGEFQELDDADILTAKHLNIDSYQHVHTEATINLLADSKSLLVLIKAYMMEVAIAIHSVIIGVSMGMMGPDEISPLRALIIAVVFHQFFEGIGLGAVLSYVRLQLGTMKVIIFVLIFGTTISIGIGIGMIISNAEYGNEDTQGFITGCANSISAGTLIYIAMVEMMAEEFANHKIMAKANQKFIMISSFSGGVIVMAILAMWA